MLLQIKKRIRYIKHQIKRRISFNISDRKLLKIDSRLIEDVDGEVRLFVMARNEALRLPYFLDYYFKNGVDRVFFIDNNSTDNTVEIALSFDNVHVFQTKESFKNYSNWMEILLDRYGCGYWCIAADVDEILHFPHSELLSIRQLASYLDEQGETALQCILLDMYSDKPISLNSYQQNENPLDVCPYFDSHFNEEDKFWLNQKTQEKFQCTRIFGNMRKRVFNLENSLSKISLFKYNADVFAGRGMHAMDGVTFSTVRGATLHFKYLQDFNNRVVNEVERGEHEGGAADYQRYAKKVEEDSELNCYYDQSVKFSDSLQLVEIGLMRSSSTLDTYVKRQN